MLNIFNLFPTSNHNVVFLATLSGKLFPASHVFRHSRSSSTFSLTYPAKKTTRELSEDSREFLSSLLSEEDASLLKLHAVSGHSRATKRQILQLQRILKEKQLKVEESMAKVEDANPRELESMKVSDLISKEMKIKAKDLDIMGGMMKKKIKVSS